MSSSSHIATSIATATDLKIAANTSFATGDYRSALSKYTRAYAYFTGLQATGEASQMSQLIGSRTSQQRQASTIEQQQIRDLQISVGNNTSLCWYKLNDGNNAVKFANKVLAVDATNTKALYRRAQGYMLLRKFGDAYDDLQQAHTLYKEQNNGSTDNAIVTAMKQCKVEVDADTAKLAQRLKHADFS